MPEPPTPPAEPAASSVLPALVAALHNGAIEIVDLTAPLSSGTPVLELPPEFGQTARFELEEISRYDERGPAWYWNNFRTGEHTGTHFDAPNHWVTGKEGADIASVPARRLVAPAVVADFSDEAAKMPTRTAPTRPACPPSAPAGWRNAPRSSGSAWRRWAPTRAGRTDSSRRSPATRT